MCIEYICLFKNLLFTLLLIRLFHTFGCWTELNTFSVISYTEVRLLILVHSENLFQDRFCKHKKELAEFICMVQRYTLLTNIRQNHRCQENYFTGKDRYEIWYEMRKFFTKPCKVCFANSWYLNIFRKENKVLTRNGTMIALRKHHADVQLGWNLPLPKLHFKRVKVIWLVRP